MGLMEWIGWITVVALGVLFLVGLFLFVRYIRLHWTRMCDNNARMGRELEERWKEKNELRQRVERQDREIAALRDIKSRLNNEIKVDLMFSSALIEVISALDEKNRDQDPIPGTLDLMQASCTIKYRNRKERSFEYVRDAAGRVIDLNAILKSGEEQPSDARQVLVMSTGN